jgi:phosphopantetheine--protein transferase-like protein
LLAHLILSRKERQTWSSISLAQNRRREWLLGRMAAKDAVRFLLKERYQIEACPADIEILTDEHGRPVVSGQLIDNSGRRLSLSIAHSDGTAVAAVGEIEDARRGLGIDLERLDKNHEAIEEVAFTPDELSLLASFQPAERSHYLLRFWCAKEALAKALGRGMMGNPLNLQVKDVCGKTGRLHLTIAGQLLQEFPDYVGRSFPVHTVCDETTVYAVSLV